MKIFKTVIIGADSAGYTLKEQIKEKLIADGYNVIDKGTDSDASCHYPIFGGAVAMGVQDADKETCGILVCGTGIGMSMVANKYDGVRAALCSDTHSLCEYLHRLIKGKVSQRAEHSARRADVERHKSRSVSLGKIYGLLRPFHRCGDDGSKLVRRKFQRICAKGIGAYDV